MSEIGIDITIFVTIVNTLLLYLNMQIAPASGAFYILDTTANSNSDAPFYSGIYLKYINLYSENTVNNDFSIYRGSFSTGKSRGINFHSGWKNESSTDFFEHCSETFSDGTHYVLSPAVPIPDIEHLNNSKRNAILHRNTSTCCIACKCFIYIIVNSQVYLF